MIESNLDGTEKPPSQGEPMANIQILIVDDDMDMRELIKGAFTSDAIKVETAVDGAQAVELLKSSRYNLIITDVNMPQMGGTELAKYIRNSRLNRECPIVAISSALDKETIEEFSKLRVTKILAKPFKLDQLVAIMKEALKKPA